MKGVLVGLLLFLSITWISQLVTLATSSESQVLQTGEIYHTGDLIVGGNETYVIENATFWIKGNIFVYDNAKLIVKNAHIIVDLTWGNEFFADLFNNATMMVENSILNTTYPMGFALRVHNNAVVVIKNSVSYWRIGAEEGSAIIDSSIVHPDVGVCVSQVSISNSEVHFGIDLCFRERGQEDVRLTRLNTNISTLYLKFGNASLKLENSKVGSWMIELSKEFGKSLIIENSSIELIMLTFSEPVNISNIMPGYFKQWNVQEFVKGYTNWNLIPINTTVNWWKLITLNDACVENVKAILDPWLDKTVVVKNSEILTLDGRGSKYLKFINSIVEHFVLRYQPMHLGGSGNFFIEFENSTVCGIIEIAAQRAFIRGDVSFRLGGIAWQLYSELPIENVNFQKGLVIREYPLFVKDENGEPAFNASIWLYNPEGELISSKVTNEEGFAPFNISFTKENYNKKWNLRVIYNCMTFSKEVGFLTDTPIVFSFQEIREEVGDAISYAEDVINWIERFNRAKSLDEAKSLLDRARTQYLKGKFDEALKLAKDIVEFLWIKIDGNPNDWDDVGITPLAVDPEGDAINASGDLKALYAISDGCYLHLMIEVYGEKPIPQMFSIDLDADSDGQGDYCIRVDKTSEFILITPYISKEYSGFRAAYGRVIEVKIPLKLIGNPKIVGIFVYTHLGAHPNPGPAMDLMGEWPFWNILSRLSSLSVSTSLNRVFLHEPITVYGSISPSHNNVSVMLSYKMPNGTILIRNVTSTELGEFEDTFTPNMAGSWTVKASWDGDLDHEGSESSEVSFTVLKAKSSLSLSASRVDLEKGDEITISGSINPSLTGVAVTLTFERPDGTNFTVTALTNTEGSFSYTFTPQDAGKWTVHASWPGNENYEGATSPSLSFTVKEPSLTWELYIVIVVGTIIIGVTTVLYKKRHAIEKVFKKRGFCGGCH